MQWQWLIPATGLALLFRYLGVFVWRLVLSRLGATSLPGFVVLADVYAKSWLARYIPGTVAWVAGRIFLASEYGISRSRLAISTLVETAAQIVGVGAVSLALLASDDRISGISPTLRWLVALGAVFFAGAMVPAVFNRLVSTAVRLSGRGTAIAIRWNVVLTSVALYGLGAMISGTSYVLLARAIATGIGIDDLAFLIGAFGLAGVAGILTPFAPSGLGTRDGVQLILLLVILPAPLAAVIVVCGRIWSAVTDLLFYILAAGTRSLSARDRIRPTR